MKEGCGILLIKYSMSCEGIIVRMNNENELEKMAVVSIIIPVYNVYEYIDSSNLSLWLKIIRHKLGGEGRGS